LGKYMYLENLILKNYRTKETELYMKAFWYCHSTKSWPRSSG
jgi:hypothetical protein